MTEGYDGYRIVVRPGKIIIAGSNERGTVYGVYDFLEHLGCRWFYPAQDPNDPEVVPRRQTISLETNSWAVKSQLEHRICNASGWFYDVQAPVGLQEIDWAMKNRFNMMGWQADSSLSKRSLESQYKKLGEVGALAELEKRGMTIHGPAHSFDQLLSSEKYFKEHPEWFGMRDGKRAPQSFRGRSSAGRIRRRGNSLLTMRRHSSRARRSFIFFARFRLTAEWRATVRNARRRERAIC